MRLLQRLRQLTRLVCAGNPFFRRDSSSTRHRFLGRFKGCATPKFRLAVLNSRPVTMDERLRGMASASLSPALSRLVLVLEAMGATGEESELDLSGHALQRVSHLAHMATLQRLRAAPPQFSALRQLNLSNNALETLEGQGLHLLPVLAALDVSQNKLPSVDHIVMHLRSCKHLKRLRMLQATRSAETVSTDVYAPDVLAGLPGLLMVDGRAPTSRLNRLQLSAVAFLSAWSDVSANSVHHIDLRHRGFTRDHFIWVMSAVSQLPVQSLDMRYNPWASAEGVGPEHAEYRLFVISAIPSLYVLVYSVIHPLARAPWIVVFHFWLSISIVASCLVFRVALCLSPLSRTLDGRAISDNERSNAAVRPSCSYWMARLLWHACCCHRVFAHALFAPRFVSPPAWLAPLSPSCALTEDTGCILKKPCWIVSTAALVPSVHSPRNAFAQILLSPRWPVPQQPICCRPCTWQGCCVVGSLVLLCCDPTPTHGHVAWFGRVWGGALDSFPALHSPSIHPVCQLYPRGIRPWAARRRRWRWRGRRKCCG